MVNIMEYYLVIITAFFLVQLFHAFTVIALFVINESLQESIQLKNKLYNKEKS